MKKYLSKKGKRILIYLMIYGRYGGLMDSDPDARKRPAPTGSVSATLNKKLYRKLSTVYMFTIPQSPLDVDSIS